MKRLVFIVASLFLAAVALTTFWVTRPEEIPERFKAGAPELPAPLVDRFDERYAFSWLTRQVNEFGYRPAGSRSSRALARELKDELPRGQLESLKSDRRLQNVVGVIPGRKPAVLIAAHYDTESEPKGFVGANDGAAGTAAVLAIARALRKENPSGREIRFALFDGEEEPAGSKDIYKDGLRGSRDYLARHRADIGQLILLDYVGGRGIRLPREGTSDKQMWASLRSAAERAGAQGAFPDRVGASVIDDHTPFREAGIPAVDLIDFEYPWKDTREDGLDKVSPRSLDLVGETVIEYLRGEKSSAAR